MSVSDESVFFVNRFCRRFVLFYSVLFCFINLLLMTSFLQPQLCLHVVLFKISFYSDCLLLFLGALLCVCGHPDITVMVFVSP